jgi:hypothetical protein
MNHKCTVLHGIANAPFMQVTSDYKLIEACENRALQMPRGESGSFIVLYVH